MTKCLKSNTLNFLWNNYIFDTSTNKTFYSNIFKTFWQSYRREDITTAETAFSNTLKTFWQNDRRKIDTTFKYTVSNFLQTFWNNY